MQPNSFKEIVTVMAQQPLVKEAVERSHDNNPWWPKSVADWRMRMIIAGLSTRVSFRMLPTYVRVISAFSKNSYQDLRQLENRSLSLLIKPLGLVETRLKYIRSMCDFLDTRLSEEDLQSKKDADLITLISKHVDGASYKVGQCCVLYAKGYHCGIMPVDSGMKDMLAPCLGFKTERTAYGHEVVRLQLEALAASEDWLSIAKSCGYDALVDLPKNKKLSWWLHLVLINYKRHFCNQRDPSKCPVAQKFSVCKTCARC